MSSFVRTLEKRMMKRAGVVRMRRGWTFHCLAAVVGDDRAHALVAKRGEALADKDGAMLGWRWPRGVPARFRPEPRKALLAA